MIINDNCKDYNPLKEIFKYSLAAKDVNVSLLNLIQRELFKGGIIPESFEEFNKVYSLLVDYQVKYYGKE